MKKEKIYIFAEHLFNAETIKNKIVKDFPDHSIEYGSIYQLRDTEKIKDSICIFLPTRINSYEKDYVIAGYDLGLSAQMYNFIEEIQDHNTILFTHYNWQIPHLEVFYNVKLEDTYENPEYFVFDAPYSSLMYLTDVLNLVKATNQQEKLEERLEETFNNNKTICIIADDVRTASNIRKKLKEDFSDHLILFSSANKFNFAISDRVYLFLPKTTTENTFTYDLKISPEMEKVIKDVKDVGTVLFIHNDWRKRDEIEIFENVDVSTYRSQFEESKRYVAFGDNLLTFKDYMDWEKMTLPKEDASKKIYIIGGDLETYQNFYDIKDILQKMYFDYLILDGNDVDFSKLKNANIIIIPENVSELKGSTYNIDLPYYIESKLDKLNLFYNNHKVLILGTIDPERYDDVRVHGNIKEETCTYMKFKESLDVSIENYDIIEKFIPRDSSNYIIRDINESNKSSKDPTIYFSKSKISDKDIAEAVRLMLRSKMPNVIIREFKGGKYNTDELLKSDYLLTLPAKIENGNIMLGKGTYNEIITALDKNIPVHIICEGLDPIEKDFITFSPNNKNCIKVIDRNWTDSYATIESFNFKSQKFINFFDRINAYNPYRIKDNFTDDNFKDTKKLNLSKTFKDIFQDIEVVNKGVKIVAVYDEKTKKQNFQIQYEQIYNQYMQNITSTDYEGSFNNGIINPRIGVPFGAPWTSTKPFSLDAPPLQEPWNTSGIILNNDPSFKLYLRDEKIAEFKKIINENEIENEIEYDEEACEVIIKKTNQNLKGIIPLGVLKDFPDIYIIKTKRPFIEENLSLKKLYKFNYE